MFSLFAATWVIAAVMRLIMRKRIIFYSVVFAIVFCLISMLRPVHVSSCNVVISNPADWVTRDHVFHTLAAEGIESMALGSLGNDRLFLKIPESQFEDAKQIVESTATSSRTIRILGVDERGDLWVDRGTGEEFSTEPGQAINQLSDIPEKFRDLVDTINRKFPKSMITNEHSITRFVVSTRRYLDSTAKLQTGFDVTFDIKNPDQTTVSTTYQLTDAMDIVRIIWVENIE